jgi:biotin carboxyl carrier protein
LLGWRIDGRAPLRWRLQPEGGGDGVEAIVAQRRVRVGGGPWRDAHVEHAGAGRLAVTLTGVRRVWACAQDGEVTRLGLDGRTWAFRDEVAVLRDEARDDGAELSAPVPGSVLLVDARAGDSVDAGDVLVVLESMKMELQLVAAAAGIVERVAVVAGDRVAAGDVLVVIGAATAAGGAGEGDAP